MGKFLDIKGERYGKLIVKRKTKERNSSGSVIWECKCDCGKTVNVSSNSLRMGTVSSCGCSRAESNEKNISGKKIGRLTAIKKVGKTKDGALWLFQCDCGKKVELSVRVFNDGKTLSCGCINSENNKIKLEKNHMVSTNIYNLKHDDKVLFANNTSGSTGVCWDKSRNKWRAEIAFQKYRYSQRFDKKEDAEFYRKIMKQRRDEFICWYEKLTEEQRDYLKNINKEQEEKLRDLFKEYMSGGEFPQNLFSYFD